MQLNLAFVDPPEPTSGSTPTTWDQLDEAARIAALGMLAALIARMLAAEPVMEAGNE